MTTAELFAEGLGRLGLDLDEPTRERELRFLEELLRWNKKVNLTAIDDPLEGVEKHLLDSLTLLPLLGPRERLLDLGSGGGLPGIPLKLARPGLTLTSVEAVQKKVLFQRHALRLLGGAGAEVVHARAEELATRPAMKGAFTMVAARAVAELGELVRLAAPFLAPAGLLVAMKGREGEREVREAEGTLERLGWRCRELLPLELPFSGSRRVLVILERRGG